MGCRSAIAGDGEAIAQAMAEYFNIIPLFGEMEIK
jgi:hypothetical protein